MAKGVSKTLVSSLKIIRSVAEFYNVDVEDLIHGDRRRKYSEPRHVAMYLVYELLGMEKEDIGKIFGKGRVLVHYAVTKIGGYVSDPRYNRRAAACVETIKNG